MLEKILIMSLTCWGAFVGISSLLAYTRYTPERILTVVPDWLSFILTPVIGCITCSATFWGTLAFLFTGGGSLGEWFVCWLGCAALNWFISHWFEV